MTWIERFQLIVGSVLLGMFVFLKIVGRDDVTLNTALLIFVGFLFGGPIITNRSRRNGT